MAIMEICPVKAPRHGPVLTPRMGTPLRACRICAQNSLASPRRPYSAVVGSAAYRSAALPSERIGARHQAAAAEVDLTSPWARTPLASRPCRHGSRLDRSVIASRLEMKRRLRLIKSGLG